MSLPPTFTRGRTTSRRSASIDSTSQHNEQNIKISEIQVGKLPINHFLPLIVNNVLQIFLVEETVAAVQDIMIPTVVAEILDMSVLMEDIGVLMTGMDMVMAIIMVLGVEIDLEIVLETRIIQRTRKTETGFHPAWILAFQYRLLGQCRLQ